MKKILTLLIIFWNVTYIYSQNDVYYSSGNLNLNIDLYTNKFRIYFEVEYDGDTIPGHMSPRFIYGPYSNGSVYKRGNKLFLYDPQIKRYYIFNLIDKYTLVSTKNTALINKNDTLRAVSIGKEDGSPCESLSWKNNKRHGIWNYFFDSGISKVKYVNGAKIDSVFQTYKDINAMK
jgi:hypothetical protein